MNGYHLRWHTIVGAALLILLLSTIFLPGVSINAGKYSGSKTRLYLAKWCLTVSKDLEFDEADTEGGIALKISEVGSTLRLWGWLIYIPFLTAMVLIVFMLIKGRTLSGALLFEGAGTLLCECLSHFLIPSMLLPSGKSALFLKTIFLRYSGVSWIIVSTLAVLMIIYSIFCMILWARELADEKSGRKSGSLSGKNRASEDGSGGMVTRQLKRTAGELRGIKGEYMGQGIEIRAGEEIVLGRDPQYCMLIFSSQKVSRRQCGVRYDAENNSYQIIDYSSGGTTLADGRLLATSEYTVLHPGAVIYIAGGAEVFMMM